VVSRVEENEKDLPGGTRKLLTEGSAYAVATFAPVVTGLLVTPFVTRMLGTHEYGQVALGLSVYQIAAVVLALGLPASVTRHVLLEPTAAPGAVGIVITAVPMAAGLAGISAAVVSLLAGGSSWAARGAVVAVALASAFGIAVTTLCLAYLRALSRVRLFVGLAMALAWLAPVLGLATLALGRRTGLAYLTALAVGQCTIALLALGVVWATGRPEFSREALRRAFAIGLPTMPHQLAMVAASSFLVVAATALRGSSEAGRLQLAAVIGSLPVVVIGAFNNAWAPMIYRVRADARVGAVEESASSMSALAGVLSVGVALLAPVGLAILGSPEMASSEATRAAVLVATSAPFMVLYLANMHLVFAAGRTAWLAITTPLSVIVAYCVALLGLHLSGPTVGWPLAAAVPLFYALQIGMSVLLRRRVEMRPLHLRASAWWAFGSTICCVTIAAAQPPLAWRVGVAIVLAAGVGMAIVVRYRSERVVTR